MAIFGKISDIPLPDVLAMTSNESGVLHVWEENHTLDYILHLAEGFLTALIYQGQPVRDILEVRSCLIGLVKLQKGHFEYEPSERIQRDFSLPISQLTVASLTAAGDVPTDPDLLPNERTVFQVAPHTPIWLGEELQQFWLLAEGQLEQGASAHQLALSTAMEMQDILVSLYKLRVAGMIAPMRAYDVSLAPPAPVKTPKPIRRLQLDKGVRPPMHDLQSVTVSKPENTLLSWLMGKLQLRRQQKLQVQ